MADSKKLAFDLDVAVVGAGFAGLYLIHRLRAMNFSVKAFEAEDALGGTWYRNRYPGLRCDVESLQYCYSFSEDLERDWNWTERFATQAEILRYINYVADRFGLRSDIVLSAVIRSAIFDQNTNKWTLTTGGNQIIKAKFCVMATGCISAARIPDLAGLDTFEGQQLHTAAWPHDGADLRGKSVGVLGTGSSGVQVIPEIAKQAAQLFVFQRTPTFVVPARNAQLADEQIEFWKSNVTELRRVAREKSKTGSFMEVPKQSAMDVDDVERDRIYAKAWERGRPEFAWAFNDLITNLESNRTAAEFVRKRIYKTVRDPNTAEKLVPVSYPIFSKRICVGTDYYETFNCENVTLVDLQKSPILGMTKDSVKTTDREYKLDVMVFATGFDAVTGALDQIDIRGLGGQSLKGEWRNGPRCYLGLMSAGFPNMFIVTGPGSPSVLSNVVMSIEQHVEWIGDCLQMLRQKDVVRIDAEESAESEWLLEVESAAKETLYLQADSWYLGANIPGKPRVFMPYVGGVGRYRYICSEVAKDGYRGFTLKTS
jgi:cyclohexanone monooxygenase